MMKVIKIVNIISYIGLIMGILGVIWTNHEFLFAKIAITFYVFTLITEVYKLGK